MESLKIRLSGIVDESVVDGPGIRFSIFTQGCIHNCLGCHNPQTHALDGGFSVSCDELIKQINDTSYLSGVTFSGGEPFLQPKQCTYIASRIKKNYSIMVYTGFLFEDLLEMGKVNFDIIEFLNTIDILVDGPFVLSKRSLELKFKGSSNQRVIDVGKSLVSNKIELYDKG